MEILVPRFFFSFFFSFFLFFYFFSFFLFFFLFFSFFFFRFFCRWKKSEKRWRKEGKERTDRKEGGSSKMASSCTSMKAKVSFHVPMATRKEPTTVHASVPGRDYIPLFGWRLLRFFHVTGAILMIRLAVRLLL